jgi:hypothetical protein
MSAVRWGLAIGAIGFCIGFFLPMLIDPTSGNGPMLGTFITGPGGFIVGLLVGAIRSHMRKMDPRA